jgi:diguanylate cyclase (GGDEF)-like protein
MPEPTIALLPLGNRAGTTSSVEPGVTEDSGMTKEVEDPASADAPGLATSGRRGHRVHLLTIVLVAMAVFLLIDVVAPLRAIPAPRQIPWWVLIPLFCAAEVFVVHIQFRRDAQSFSLSELPLVVGFFFAPPLVVLLSMVAGTALALSIHRRQSPLKLAFNLANFTVANSVVAVLFMHLVDHHDALSATSFLGVLIAILAGGVVQSLVILTAISFSEGRIDRAGIASTFGFTQAATVVNTCLALIGVRIVWENPSEIWLLAIPTVGVFIAYRFYVAEREKRDQVDFLYQSSKQLQRTEAVDDAVAALLSKSCEVFRAELAEITFLPTRERDAVVRTAVDKEQTTQFMTPVTLDDAELQFMSRLLLDSPLLLSAHGKTGSDSGGFLESRGLRDAMAVVLRGENNMVGTMLIANRLGEVTGFDDEDLRLLEMLANQTGVILERGRLQHSLSQLTVLQDQLRHEASHDPLTGMANRLLFGSRVEQALAQTNQHVGVLFIDIDDFKTVNDSLGHAAGDELLRSIADRIGKCLRPGDVAARLGGDEFAVLLIGIDEPATAVRIADRVIEALREPFIIAAEEVLTHASIGIATAIDTVCDGQELLQNADLALYTAKSSGKSRWELFEPAMYAAVQRRHRLKADLYHAVESVEFELVYQPIVRVATSAIVAAEALLRWRHPTRGTVLPDDFISLVEETGLITQLGEWVLRSACEEAQSWPPVGGGDPVAVSVNVAVRQLREPDYVDSVRNVLVDTGLPASLLILEVTEADIIYDTEPIIECLNELRKLGVRIALDDFGTGHSSLSRLRDFPVDLLKIDRSFTASLCGPTQSIGFAHSVFNFGVGLNLTVIAEGVETEECLRELGELGCELAQGFLFGQPLTPLAMRRLLEHNVTVPIEQASLPVMAAGPLSQTR